MTTPPDNFHDPMFDAPTYVGTQSDVFNPDELDPELLAKSARRAYRNSQIPLPVGHNGPVGPDPMAHVAAAAAVGTAGQSLTSTNAFEQLKSAAANGSAGLGANSTGGTGSNTGGGDNQSLFLMHQVQQDVRLIREAVWARHLKDAAAAAYPPEAQPASPAGAPPGTPDPKDDDKKPKATTWKDAFKPVTDAAKRTRLGGIADRFAGHAKKPAKELAAKFKNRGKPGPAGPKPTPPGGKPPVPPVPPPGANAAAGAEAGAAGGAGGAAAGAAGAEAGAAGAGVGAGIAAAGPAAIVIGAVIALNELQKAGRALAYQQENYARELAQVSPRIQASIAQLDANRTFRSADMADATADSSERLSKAIDRWETSTQKFEQVAENLKNAVGGAVLDVLSGVAEDIEMILKAADIVARWIPGGGSILTPRDNSAGDLFGDFVKRVYDEQHAKNEAAKAAARRSAQFGRGNQSGGGF